MRSMIDFMTKFSPVLASRLVAIIISMTFFSTLAVANIAETYDNSCAACHDSGALNAIKKGDTVKWQSLIQRKGMPTLIKSVKNGMTQMPAGGLCNECSDDDHRQLIEYMSK